MTVRLLTRPPRFSLRALFVIIALAAAALAWFVVPELTARRFAGHINAERYQEALAMLPAGSSPHLEGVADQPERYHTGATIGTPSWSDLWMRRREVTIIKVTIYRSHESPGLSAYAIRLRVVGHGIEPIPFEEGGLLP